MAKFDWETEEQESAWTEPAAKSRPERSRIQWILLAMAGFSLLAGYFLYRQALRRIQAAETTALAEVRSSQSLLQSAYTETDRELLDNLLSGRDRRWVASQKNLLQSDLLYDRPSLGLYLTVDPIGAERPQTITLSTDLTTATVSTLWPYEFEPLGQEFMLLQTQIFRRGEERWLLTPLLGDAWTQQGQVQGPYVDFNYPVGDEALVLRLADDLNQAIDILCSDAIQLACDGNHTPRFTLELTTDPESLLDLERRIFRPGPNRFRQFPTPTLIGLPVDEAGYLALRSIYARFLLTPWLRDQTRHRPSVWPGHDYQVGWLIDEWLRQAGILPPLDLTVLQVPTPDLPDGTLLLACAAGKTNRLVAYSPRSGTFETLGIGGRILDIKSHSDGRLLAVRQDDLGLILTWRDFSQPLAAFPILEPVTDFTWEEASGRAYLNTIRLGTEPQDLDLVNTFEIACSDNRCQASEFRGPPADSITWSPEGTRAIINQNNRLTIFRPDGIQEEMRIIRDGVAMESIGGRSPFWVSETQWRMVTGIAESGTRQENRLVTMTFLPASPPQWVISNSEGPALLIDAVSPEERPENLLILYATPDPAAPETSSIILALELQRARYWLFSLNHRRMTAELIGESPGLAKFFISTSGRLIGLIEATAGSLDFLHLHNRPTGETRLLSLENQFQAILDLSPDEDWLLILDQGSLRFLEPATGREIRLPQAIFGGCYDASWLSADPVNLP